MTVDGDEGGYRAEVRILDPPDCPVADLTRDGAVESYGVTRSTRFDEDVEVPIVTEEMLFDGDPDVDDADADLEHVFSYDDKEVYRFDRDGGRGCACEHVETHGCPVVESQVRDGDLYLTFHSAERESLRAALQELEQAYDDVEVRRMLKTREERDVDDLVFVDRSGLTDRQQEVLETAHQMGYFDHPKGANGQDVADAIGIAPTTFSEHLSRAQHKILEAVVR